MSKLYSAMLAAMVAASPIPEGAQAQSSTSPVYSNLTPGTRITGRFNLKGDINRTSARPVCDVGASYYGWSSVQVDKGATTQLVMGRSLVNWPSTDEVPTFGTFLPSEGQVRTAKQIKPGTISTPLANGAFKQIDWESWDKCGAVGKAVQEVRFNGKTALIPGTLILDQPVPYSMVTNTMFYDLADGRSEPGENPQSKWGFSYLYFVPDSNARAYGIVLMQISPVYTMWNNEGGL
ncbi:hypothetical protein HHL24_02920 [Paraburkholderia sp. RP-4-7]|uniref:Uncharacterized protein n=1 Tax=Paraburkholderia polaris TaxID=2728848 RepID=A0A848I8T5_9BURK|nr:hypothetical protein [Paraburkholderia polaris]NML96915.1 hypothetical protein [Paraburkholderia polaris]